MNQIELRGNMKEMNSKVLSMKQHQCLEIYVDHNRSKHFQLHHVKVTTHCHSLTVHTAKNMHIHIFFQQENMALKW